MRPAADIDEVGWPDPAAVLARMLSTRNWFASCRRNPTSHAPRPTSRVGIAGFSVVCKADGVVLGFMRSL